MLIRISAAAALLTVTLPVHSQTPTQVTAPVPAQTTQQLFDAGTDAMNKEDWAKALEIYTILESRLSASKSVRSKAIVQLRKGNALWQLRGDDEAATPMLVKALDALPETDLSLAKDRYDASLTLGKIATAKFDYAAASGHFRKAAGSADTSSLKYRAYSRLVAIGMFVDPAQALVDADAILALVKAEPKVNPEWQGLAHNLRGRVLLNLQRPAEARKELAIAIRLLGGLNYGKVNQLDISARSDAAIAEFRTGQTDAARKLLSFSGAAMVSSQGFALGAKMQPPDCDPAKGLSPDDVAVVEFSIRNDGSVGGAQPVYFSGKPAAAIEFAEAVSAWVWNAAELKEVLPFFRQQTRLEMRCSTASKRPDALNMLWPDVDTWLKSNGVVDIAKNRYSDAEFVTVSKQELARRDALAAGSVQAMIPLHLLAGNPALPAEEAGGFADRALLLAKAHNAPPSVQAYYTLYAAYLTKRGYRGRGSSKYERRLSDAIAEPVIASNPTARNALTIALYDALSPGGRNRDGRAMIARVANDATTPANDPYKVGALIRLANLEAEGGKMDDARTLFQKSGLSAQQCALVDASPRKTVGSIGSSDYPAEALSWGFGGWTVVEFDIDAEGRTKNVRSLISFPPFVFGDPTVQQIKRFRYEQSYRPEGGLGCGGQQQRVTYRSGL